MHYNIFTSDHYVFVHSIFSVAFLFFMLSLFLSSHDFATYPFSVHHKVLYIAVGNCPSFLASPTFIARTACRYDCLNKAIRAIPFFSLVPLVRMSPTFLPCITVHFAALTSFASESSTTRDLYLVRSPPSLLVSDSSRCCSHPLSPRCVPALSPFFESITRPAARR